MADRQLEGRKSITFVLTSIKDRSGFKGKKRKDKEKGCDLIHDLRMRMAVHYLRKQWKRQHEKYWNNQENNRNGKHFLLKAKKKEKTNKRRQKNDVDK